MTPASVRAWRRVHTASSLVCTAFLLVACVTGLAMIWIHEIDTRLAGHPPVQAAPATAGLTDLDTVFADARRRTPGEVVTYADWAFEGDLLGVNMAAPDDTGRRRQLVYDARTGVFQEDLRQDNADHPVRWFLRIMNRLHIELFAGEPGKWLLAAMTVLFIVATVSGAVLYGPFSGRLAFGEVRAERARRTAWLDLHNLMGMATLGWVLVVAVTGVMNAFTVPAYAAWRKAVVPDLVAAYRGQPAPADGVGPARAVRIAEAANPGSRMVRIVAPGYRDGSPLHYVVWTQGATPVTSKLFRPVLVAIDSGAVTLASPPPWWLSALQLSRPLHFGNYAGVPLKILWTLLDLAAIAILGSGLYLYLARRRRPEVR